MRSKNNTKQIHVVHIIPTLRFGGAERTVVDIINNADPEVFRFSVIVFFDDVPMQKEITRPNVNVLVVQKRGKVSLSLLFRLTKVLRRLRPDVVHTHLFGGDVWGRIAARELGVPVITTEHNMNIEEGKTKHWVKKKLNKYSAVYTACSRAVATYAEEAYALPKKKMVVVRPGVVLDRFSQLASPVFEKKPVRFLLLGRLTKQKGHRLAIHALSHIPTKDWRLTIAGDGEDSGELLALVRRLGLSDVIRMLPGTRDIEDLYRKSNVVIVPSLWEGLGIVAMEGMAAGRLVIGAKTGGLPEVISHKKTGLLFRAGDVAALRDVIGYALSHLEACRQIARMGQAHAIQHFGVSSMARRYESLYRGMVGNKS